MTGLWLLVLAVLVGASIMGRSLWIPWIFALDQGTRSKWRWTLVPPVALLGYAIAYAWLSIPVYSLLRMGLDDSGATQVLRMLVAFVTVFAGAVVAPTFRFRAGIVLTLLFAAPYLLLSLATPQSAIAQDRLWAMAIPVGGGLATILLRRVEASSSPG